ncbi:FtsX-like permease family protein [Rhodoglobus sp.]
MRLLNLRDHASSILVAALSSAFGVALLQLTNNLATSLTLNEDYGQRAGVQMALSVLASVFIVISVYVGSIVTANTFATVIAGRTRTIALVRLIGGSARSQREQVAREGLAVGAIGAVIGAIFGALTAFAIFQFAQSTDVLPTIAYSFFDPIALLPIVGVVLTTWLAAWVGSRRVLTVTPMQALGASVDSLAHSGKSAVRRVVGSTLLCGVGLGVVVLGMLVGLVTQQGMLISLVGGVISFTGFILGAQFVMPRVLRAVGSLIGRGASGELAAKNALRYPERSTRITLGLVIGVTLITMFAVATESFRFLIMISPAYGESDGAADALSVLSSTFSILIGFSAIIAAVGLVNTLSLSIVQRTRELGLLRALGFTAAQLRAMIRVESAQLTIAASLVGLILGTFYGWAGAQSLLGSTSGSAVFVLPVIPWWILVATVILAGGLALTAAIAPARRVTRITPVEALAVE